MKKLFLSAICTILMLSVYSKNCTNISGKYVLNEDELKEFYIHLGNHMKYPNNAQRGDLQGNSIILFSVVDGKLKDLKIENGLGNGFDTEVLNNILSFTNFKNIKTGNYALNTSFRLQGSTSKIINQNALIPPNYIELKLTITAYAPDTEIKTGSTNKELIKTADPLIILDDKIITIELNAISPETIESIVVLKDNAAITKYGDQGKNGVLIITTKKAIPKKGSTPILK